MPLYNTQIDQIGEQLEDLGEAEVLGEHQAYFFISPNREKYFGTPKTGPEAIPELHFPGILPETTKWLIKNKNIKNLIIDYISDLR